MAKLVDALVSGSSAERHAGSIPVPGTVLKTEIGICQMRQIPFFVGGRLRRLFERKLKRIVPNFSELLILIRSNSLKFMLKK